MPGDYVVAAERTIYDWSANQACPPVIYGATQVCRSINGHIGIIYYISIHTTYCRNRHPSAA